MTLLSAWSRHHEAWLLAVILVMGALLGIVAPGFLSVGNVVDLLETYSVQGILALGLFVVLVSGGIDISFMAVASVAQYLAAFLAARWHWPGIVCIPIGLLAGVALGAINATLIHFVRVTSIIATIATKRSAKQNGPRCGGHSSGACWSRKYSLSSGCSADE